jgi:hypothetical protein
VRRGGAREERKGGERRGKEERGEERRGELINRERPAWVNRRLSRTGEGAILKLLNY